MLTKHNNIFFKLNPASMTAYIILIALFVFSMLLMHSSYDKKTKIIFFGDSITEFGLKQGGYLRWIESFIKEEGLSSKIQVIGAGISGNTVQDLNKRVERDIIARSPDWVVVYIGINDVWQLEGNNTQDFLVFQENYATLIKRMLSDHIKVVVCTLSLIGEKKEGENERDNHLEEYSEWIRVFANNHHLPIIDIRKYFTQYEVDHNYSNNATGVLTLDGVHLNNKGNQILGELMWEVLKSLIKK